MNSILYKIFIYLHKNLFAPQAQDLLEKLAAILLYNFRRELILLKLKTKKLLRKIKSKNITAGVFLGVTANIRFVSTCSRATRAQNYIASLKLRST